MDILYVKEFFCKWFDMHKHISINQITIELYFPGNLLINLRVWVYSQYRAHLFMSSYMSLVVSFYMSKLTSLDKSSYKSMLGTNRA